MVVYILNQMVINIEFSPFFLHSSTLPELIVLVVT